MLWLCQPNSIAGVVRNVTAIDVVLPGGMVSGEADALHIALREEDGSAICAISNNGSLPEGEITPQGGLKNLYRHVENCGGRMDIRCRPAFTLTITIPAGKEEKP